MGNYTRRTRFVKLYFRDQKKIMRSIPNLTALVSDNSLVKMYTLDDHGLMNKVIWELKE